ncbi:peptidoglycan D,D-transpeptidase FtsI family protein [Celeribacter indicus]|uniref:Peptidoglycan synthetase FtsI n=1 Tax=Celeribacter indicus TaxID=1208324 RepID=A0A0B5DWU6_9RHOB|nr:penicillin-binding protein 2 [Celeribacter indicus]AJE47928.1 peptidoglycan synthetase FtsI [Celeribacter indicus]SDW27175.1 cell division protein FtsI (penicillin-binding protein 3) [Celeribacter indicus]
MSSTRTPLRPLARILQARSKGENPDAIEKENLRIRHEEMRDRSRLRAEGRLLVLGLCFVSAFVVVGLRMGQVAATVPEEPRADASGTPILAQRADIVDRNGRILATNRVTHSLYAQPQEMVDPLHAADELVKIFPDLDRERLIRDFTGQRKFLWIKKKIAPEQQQAVHDIGEPGLLFGPREERLYPNGKLAAHILGGTKFGREGVMSAEIVGQAGVEKARDAYLSDPANGDKPLQLSIDLTVQSTVREVLYGGMKMLDARGAAAVMMDANTGEIISMVSLPDFDPNSRPEFFKGKNPADNPRFNRAVQGVYELGSTFKIFAAAQAMEIGLAGPGTQIPATPPFRWGKFRIHEFEGHNYGPYLSLRGMIVKSSNVATAYVAQQIGVTRQQEFLKSLGFFEATPVELSEAPSGKPLLPPKWSELSTLTIGYGHGLSASPLHLATAYASVLNGGHRVEPTLLKREGYTAPGPQVVRPEVSAAAREMLRAVVSDPAGTASFAEVPGYRIGGKTGTADKPRENGRGYYNDKTITTFASIFPADDPKYVLIVSLDEAVETAGPRPRRTAGWTAVPVAAEIIRRTAPLMGLRPEIETAPQAEVTLTSSH